MPSRPVLDSPPVELPPAPQRLKRSSSLASLASLPTPPRTISKRKRSQSRASSAVDSNDDSDGSVSSRPVANKRRKILDTAKEDEAQERAFWLGVPTPPPQRANQKDVVQLRSPSPTRSMSPEAAPSYRAQKTGLVSPPPSRRQPARKVKQPATPKASTSKQRKGKGKAAQELPIRDSPNNPFLDDGNSSLVASSMKTPPRRQVALEEKPTLTYVFRGQKQEMNNPLYKYKPPSASRLPPEHPDFSPSIACPPKLLFPAAHRRKQPQRNLKRARSASPNSEGDDEDNAPGDKISPMGKLTVANKPDSRQRRAPHIESQRGRQKRPTKR